MWWILKFWWFFHDSLDYINSLVSLLSRVWLCRNLSIAVRRSMTPNPTTTANVFLSPLFRLWRALPRAATAGDGAATHLTSPAGEGYFHLQLWHPWPSVGREQSYETTGSPGPFQTTAVHHPAWQNTETMNLCTAVDCRHAGCSSVWAEEFQLVQHYGDVKSWIYSPMMTLVPGDIVCLQAWVGLIMTLLCSNHINAFMH